MKIIHKLAAITITTTTAALSLFASPVMAFSVTPTNNAETLKNLLLGDKTDGLSNFSLSVSGNTQAFGIFDNDPFSLKSGVVLSTGRVSDLPGPSDSFANTDLGSVGYAGDLAQLNLEFFADQTADKLFFQYVFGSEEFPEWGGSAFNDSFELLLNGVNLAKLSNGQNVTINNLVPVASDRSKDHPDYINNPVGSSLASTLIKLDGFTKVLGFEGLLKKNQTNVLSIRIQDVGDGVYDSAVFIKGGSIGTAPPEAVPEPVTVAGALLGGAALVSGRRLQRRNQNTKA